MGSVCRFSQFEWGNEMNLLQQIEQEQIEKVTKNKRIDDFAPGDTLRVNVRIVEGESERIQAFEGVCIAKKDRGVNSSFTVRKISQGEGVERIFPLYSPRLESIVNLRRGVVRRAKLYYLRGLTGKAARIREKQNFAQATETTATSGKTAKVKAAKAAKATKAAKAE